jgi:Putative auto-transporter adhesin, head GIN domain
MARILLVTILVALLAACTSVTGSGKLVSRSFELDGFTRIDASHGAQVEVTRGDTFSVNVEVDDNVADKLDVSVSGDTLFVGLKIDSQINVTFRVQVTMPELKGVSISGGSRLQAVLAGEDLAVNVSGGSRATLTGTAGRVSINASGGSQALLADLAAGDTDLEASGGSHVEVNSSGRVSGEASGGSSVVVSGSPNSVNVETSGGASVKTP